MAEDREMERLLGEYEPRLASRLSRREALSEGALATVFLGVATALALVVGPAHGWSWGETAALVVAYAAVGRAQFQVGPGYTMPTELVLVPMLFVAPLGAAPLLVAAANVLRGLPEYATGRRAPEKVLLDVNDAWHVTGPVALLAATGAHHPEWGDWPVYAAALGAQFAVDLAAACTREWLALHASPRALVRVLVWVWLVDALLAPVGLLAAFAAAAQPYAFLLVVPLAIALGVFAEDRRRHIDKSLQLSAAHAELERREHGRREALEINDDVVQHLAVARYLLDRGEDAEARALVDLALDQAKRIISDLLEDSRAGELRRRASATIESAPSDEAPSRAATD